MIEPNEFMHEELKYNIEDFQKSSKGTWNGNVKILSSKAEIVQDIPENSVDFVVRSFLKLIFKM